MEADVVGFESVMGARYEAACDAREVGVEVEVEINGFEVVKCDVDDEGEEDDFPEWSLGEFF